MVAVVCFVINGGHFVYEALVGREVDHDVGVVVSGQHLGRLSAHRAGGGRLALRRHGAAVLNWAKTAFSRAALSAGPRTTRPAPGVAPAEAGQDCSAGRDDLDGARAEPVPDGHHLAREPRGHAVIIALETDRRDRGYAAGGLDRGWVRPGWQRQQALQAGQRADGPGAANSRAARYAAALLGTERLFELGHRPGAVVGYFLAETLELGLGPGHGGGRHGAPETLGGEVDGLFESTEPLRLPAAGAGRQETTTIAE